MSKVLTIQDYSCYGQCSLTVALPLLSALSHELVSLPTAILSTHTSGFKNFVVHDLTNFIHDILNHWRNEKLSFDALITGYLGTNELVDIVKEIKKDFIKKDGLIIIDPAMGDEGRLYPAFDKDYVIKTKELLPIADILLPNITEAAFLSETEYKSHYDEQYVKDILIKLHSLGAKNIILTDISFDENTTGVYSYINNEFSYYKHEKIKEKKHGTGDIFTSVFSGAYLLNHDYHKSIKMAADYVFRCIKSTLTDPSHWYGVKVEVNIKQLIKDIEK